MCTPCPPSAYAALPCHIQPSLPFPPQYSQLPSSCLPQVLEGHTEAVLALAVNSTQLVSGSYDTTVRFWDLATWHCVRKCDGHEDAVRVLATAEGRVFSGSYDGTIGVW